MLLWAGAQVFGRLVRVVRDLRLTHFLADLTHEGSMELAAELTFLEVVSEFLFRAGVLARHVVQHLVEHGSLALAF